MGNEFQFFDIILFALIAVFLVLRLRNTLGRRDGNDGSNYRDPFKAPEDENPNPHAPAENNDNVIPLPGHEDDQQSPWAADDAEEEDLSPIAAGVAQVQAADPSFNLNAFLDGSRSAFEMVLNAYASGDVRTLKSLLSAEVFENFAKAVSEREEAGQTLEETLVGFKNVEAVEVYMEDRAAHVTVKFVSEQVSALRDGDGTVIEGDPQAVFAVTDFWTFGRDTRSRNPNWTLIATRSLD